jgi:protein-S-isoprenylcysteine O-methyltransferase Ste14
MTKAIGRALVYVAFFALLLFVPAGTADWWRAWVLLGILLVARIAGTIAVQLANPGLLRERSRVPLHAGQPLVDKVLVVGVMAGFAALPAVAGLDRFRWHVLPTPAPVVSGLGLVLFTAGWWIVALTLLANAFAVTVVRHQEERHHALVDTGVYRIVRHPMYAGMVLVMAGLGLWLGSYLAALVALLPVSILVVRIGFEERFLLGTLPGYAEYTSRVRARLIPGVW